MWLFSLLLINYLNMIIFLYGEDTYRSRNKLNELKEKFKHDIDQSGDSIANIDGETATMEKIGELVSPTSLFTRKRMVIIENIFSSKKQKLFSDLIVYLKKSKGSEENIIIFREEITSSDKLPKYKNDLLKFLEKQEYVQEFKSFSNTEAIAWAKKEVNKRGGKISQQAARELTALLGSDLWQTSNEIDKLLAYRLGREEKIIAGGEPPEIGYEDVKTLVRGKFDENIFALTDAIGNKNKALAIKLFEEQLEAGLNDSYLITMIVRQFKILLQIKTALDQGNTSRKIINILKLHPFVVQKGINQARNFSEVLLKGILSQLVVIDSRIKTGRGEAKVMLNLLMARL